MGEMRSAQLPFPLRGVTENSPYGAVPTGYTPRALNAVGFDPLSGRLRGGKRPGTARPIQAPVVEGEPIQALGQITLSSAEFVDPAGFFTDPDYVDDNWGWEDPGDNDWVDPEWPPPSDPWIPISPPQYNGDDGSDGTELTLDATVDEDTITLDWVVE